MGKEEDFRDHTRAALEYITGTIDGSSRRYYAGIFSVMDDNISRLEKKVGSMEVTVNRVSSIDIPIKLMSARVESLSGLRDYIVNTENRVNEVQKTVNNLFNQMNTLSDSLGKLISEKNNADRDLLAENERLKGEVNLLNQQVNENKSLLKDLKDNILNLSESKDRIQESLNNANAKISANENEIQKLNNDLKVSILQNNRDQETIRSLKDSLLQRESSLEEKKEIISEKNSSISSLENKISGLEDTVADFREKLMVEKDGREADKKKYEAEIANLRKEIEHINAENNLKISKLTTELEEVSSIKDQLNSRVNSIDSSFDGYKPLLSSLRNCPTFSSILSANGITGNDDVGDLSNLSRLVGNNNISFADLIYSTALDNKKASKEYMTNEEAEVYAAVNKCYREVCNIDYDLFINPGEQKVNSPYEKVKFNKMEVDNMLDPRKNVLKFSKRIFVPMMKSLTGVLRAKGQVEASNI